MNNTPSASPKKTPTAASATDARKHIRASAIWLMNAAALTVAMGSLVTHLAPEARATFLFLDTNYGTAAASAGLVDSGGSPVIGTSSTYTDLLAAADLNDFALNAYGSVYGLTATATSSAGVTGYSAVTTETKWSNASGASDVLVVGMAPGSVDVVTAGGTYVGATNQTYTAYNGGTSTSTVAATAGTNTASQSRVIFGSSTLTNGPTVMGGIIIQKTIVAGGYYTFTINTSVTSQTQAVTLTGGALSGTTTGLSTLTGTNGTGTALPSFITAASGTSAYRTDGISAGQGGITIYQKSDVNAASIFSQTQTSGNSSQAMAVTTAGMTLAMSNDQAFVNLSKTANLYINMQLTGGKNLSTYGDITLGGGSTTTVGQINALNSIKIDAGTLNASGVNSGVGVAGTVVYVNGVSGQQAGAGITTAAGGGTSPGVTSTLMLTGGAAAADVRFAGSSSNLTINSSTITSSSAAGYNFDRTNGTISSITGANGKTSATSQSTVAGNFNLTGVSDTVSADYYVKASSGTKLSLNSLTLNGYTNINFADAFTTTAANNGISTTTLTVANTNNIIKLNNATSLAQGTYRILTVSGTATGATSSSLSLTGSAISGQSLSLGAAAVGVGRTTYQFTNSSGGNYDLIVGGGKGSLVWNVAGYSTGTWREDVAGAYATPWSNYNSNVNSAADQHFNPGDDVTFADGGVTVTTTGTITGGDVTFSNASGAVAISGTQVGATSLTKSGAGSATIGSVANSGITNVSSGSLTLSGGTLTGAITVSGGTLTSSATGSGGVTVSGGTMTANAAISGGATVSTGGTLAANAQVSGGVTVSGGTLNYGVNNATAGNLTVSSGGTVALGAYNGSVGTVTLTDGSITGSGTLTSSAAYQVSKGLISANLAGTSGLTKSTADTVTLSGTNTLTGAYSVSAGTLVLNGSNSLTSISIASGAAVTIGNASALGSGTSAAIVSGGQLDLNGTTMTAGPTLSFAGSGLATGGLGGAIVNSSNNAATYTGQLRATSSTSSISATAGEIILSGGLASYGGSSPTITGTARVTISGNIVDGTSPTGISLRGSPIATYGTLATPQTVVISGANTYSGDTTFIQGNTANAVTLLVGSVNGLSTNSLIVSSGSTSDDNIVALTPSVSGSNVYTSKAVAVKGRLTFNSLDPLGTTPITINFNSPSYQQGSNNKQLNMGVGVTAVFNSSFDLSSLTTVATAPSNVNFGGSGNFIFNSTVTGATNASGYKGGFTKTGTGTLTLNAASR